MKFEEACKRLEEIIAKMNLGKIPLDESLKLYEEADKLLLLCNQQLVDAEKKIESLVKDRSGNLILDESGIPSTEAYEVLP